MRKIVLIFLIISISIGYLTAQKPEKIYSFAKVDKPHKYYTQQVELWWKEIEKDKQNEEAWFNFYKANRNSYYTFKEKSLDTNKETQWLQETIFHKKKDDLLKLIRENIPNTFTFYYLKGKYESTDENFTFFQKAYELRPDISEIYPNMVNHYEKVGNYEKRKEFNQKIYETNEISPGLTNYCYNLLIGLKPNSILITYGDNDTFPIWLLQDVYNIRTDVTVLLLPMLTDPKYRQRMFNKIGIKDILQVDQNNKFTSLYKKISCHILENIDEDPQHTYVSLGVPLSAVQGYEDNLYLTGLAFEYSKSNINNIPLLIDNFENKYALDYISQPFGYDISQSAIDRLNRSYIPSIFKLYDYYTSAGDIHAANKMKWLGLKIAKNISQESYDYAKSILK